MDFGIGIATSSDAWKLAQRAEELGFTHAWFYDTQMITADCFVAMGAAAMKTSRIRLGTGVLVPSNRIAAVTANAFATLNGLAPGRIDFGVGTGFSARRAMGLGAMKLADMEEYIRVVYGLLDGETVETTIEGKRRKIRFLNPDANLINTRDPIRLHVSAYGPKSQALTAKLNAGVEDASSSDVAGGAGGASSPCSRAGRRPAAPRATCMPPPGPAAACWNRASRPTARAPWRRRARARRCCCIAPPIWTWRAGRTPRTCRTRWTQRRGYIEMARGFQPPDARYLMNHRGHFVFVKPEETPVRQRRADPPHHLHRDRAGAEAAHRGAARRRLEPVRHPDHPGRGTRHRGLGPHPQGFRLMRGTAFRPARPRYRALGADLRRAHGQPFPLPGAGAAVSAAEAASGRGLHPARPGADGGEHRVGAGADADGLGGGPLRRPPRADRGAGAGRRRLCVVRAASRPIPG